MERRKAGIELLELGMSSIRVVVPKGTTKEDIERVFPETLDFGFKTEIQRAEGRLKKAYVRAGRRTVMVIWEETEDFFDVEAIASTDMGSPWGEVNLLSASMRYFLTDLLNGLPSGSPCQTV